MKKIFTLFAVAALAFAAQANELTVCDNGEYMSNVFPVYGLYVDTEGTLTQMIYPADMLAEMNGKQITEVMFYTLNNYYETVAGTTSTDATDFIHFSGATIQLSFKVVEQTGYDEENPVVVEEVTAVATAVPEYGSDRMIFVLDEPFAYNGGNLLVECKVIEPGTYGTTYFWGAGLDENTSYYEYNDPYWGSDFGASHFLPKTTFTYGEGGGEQPTERTDSPSASKVNYVEHEGDSYYNAYTVTLTPAETEPDCVIWYRIGVMEDGEYVFGEWMEYVAPFNIDEPGSYRIEAYAITEGKLESYPIADEFVVSKLTDVEELFAGKTVANVRYFNVAGQEMQQPAGLTIMVTTFTDGTQSTVKVVK